MLKKPDQNELPFMVYDCFSDVRFGGNIGGIVLSAGGLTDSVMQNIAREINAPVTGFVTNFQDREVTIRFFMPSAEIAMCGHVTVGLFSYLTQAGGNAPGTFSMLAQAGPIEVQVTANGDAPPNVLMQVGLPTIRPADVDVAELAEALGLSQTEIGQVNPLETAEAGLTHLFMQLDSLETVRGLEPDFKKLSDVSQAAGAHTVACFTLQTEAPGNTLHIRDFCPAVGADEVPASGTTNGALAGYLVRHGLVPPGAQTVLAEQGAELGRPSLIRTEITSDDGVLSDVRVGGQAVASLLGTVAGG